MLKKTITYSDFNGNELTDDFYFNLTQAEAVELNYSVEGGLEAYVNGITKSQNYKEAIELFKKLIQLSYGVKSPDGKRFIKNQQILDEFMETEAYSNLFIELATDTDAAAEFVNGIAPKALPSPKGKAAPPQVAMGR